MQRVVIIRGENIYQISKRRLQYETDGGKVRWGEEVTSSEEQRTIEKGMDVTPYELQLILNNGWRVIEMCPLTEAIAVATTVPEDRRPKIQYGKAAILIILEKTTTPKAKENQNQRK